MWIFGYGSLIWKADFPYDKKVVGYVKGYVRRFYQQSTDHRGTPRLPGRVVTLIKSKNLEDRVWGLAYKIAPENIDYVVNHLDFREKGGYAKKTVLFYPHNSPSASNSRSNCSSESSSSNKIPTVPTKLEALEEFPFYLTIYIGNENNPNYAGPEDIETIAKRIVEACGPSGSNTEYLYKLASAMRTMGPGIVDDHLFKLEQAVKVLEEKKTEEVLAISEGRDIYD